MKKIFSINNTSAKTDIALIIARIGIAALMLTHGVPKLIMLFSGDPIKFPPMMGMSATLSLGLAVFAEVFCSLFLLAGFVTRLVTIPLIITMLVAIVSIHGADPVAVKEPALHYLLVYLVLIFAGGGKYSLDSLLQRKGSVTSNIKQELQDPTLAIYQ